MTYRERFERTVAHQSVDRPPFDLDATPMSQIQSPPLAEQLRQALGISGPAAGEGLDERVLQALDIDFRRVGGMPTPDTPLARRISDTEQVSSWGYTSRLVGNDWQISRNPLRGASIEDLNRFPWPQAARVDRRLIAGYRDEAKRLYEETDYVVCAEHPVLGVMELGCWMCGFDDFLLRLALEPEFVKALFDHIYAYQRDMIELYYGAIGPYIHVTTSGDDFGTQTGPFLSARMFSEQVAPYYDARIALTRQFTSAHFFHHTCGSVYELIPRMIQSGVEILNPMQPNAKNMEASRLREAFGEQITFWGGVDTQHVLPEGTTEQVAGHVRSLLEVFGRAGGYVFAPAHNLQRDVPAENLAAMYQAAHEFYGV